MTDTVATFLAETRAALEACKRRVEAFRAGEPAEFGATASQFDQLLEPLNGKSGRVGLYRQVHPSGEVREAAALLQQEISAFTTELSMDREVYARLAALDLGRANGPGARRLVEHALRDYRRSGVDRDDATQARIRQLNEELVEIGQEFDRNIITRGRSLRLEEGHAGLAGLPPDFLAAHPEDADGAVTLSTDPQDRLAFMTYAERDDLRREYLIATQNRAVPENLPVLDRLLAKRFELAQLLGYAHWADYVTEDKMVGSAAAARAFIERVVELTRGRMEAEYAELLEFKREREPAAHVVYEWEKGYLTELLKRRRFEFDSQTVRPYFRYSQVTAGVLSTSAALYGVEFRRATDVSTWHPSVECYEVLDGGEVVARFFLDMHPRDDKFKHAAMFPLTSGLEGGALPEACLVCNFPETTDDDPGLMLHDQVTTYFHEFGHLLHHLFGGKQGFLGFSGIATEWDFVEVPSQMYEEWASDAGVLEKIATHFETGEPIPRELVRRMRNAEEYGKASRVQGQMVFALLSLSYYDRDPAGLDTTGFMIRLKREMLPSPHTEGTYMQALFGHLHGYSAMYYTYMWSLVIAKDVFSRFDGNLMDADTADEYRGAVLAAGGSRDASELVEAFLGREYGYDAFEAWVQR